ncbi:MAG: NADPH-dependent glutamate synthase [Geobacteraceae bacterium]|nr:NADPH-dependent glutamate synthase [Geobacteraceae bacterium]
MRGDTLSVGERLAIKRVAMPELDPAQRSSNFKEVNLGLAEEQAVREAQRCLQCKSTPCIDGCPVQIDIPGFIGAIAERHFAKAVEILQRDNALPAVCGRVCPQEVQCESRCVLGRKDNPVAIGYLERFVADWALRHDLRLNSLTLPGSSGKNVAVIGCGPAGLTAAAELAVKGHSVKIFEALHDTGGVLRYGIPEFRLPKDIIDSEVSRLLNLGVEIECNVVVGKTITLGTLRDEFDAVFIGNGAGLPVMLGIPGENLKGVYSANEYLTRVNLMGAGQTPDCATPILRGRNVAVIGGGNTAMDCVRVARRLGAERAMLVYRRTESEMPARVEEVKHAKEEGIELLVLAAPLEVVGDDNGWTMGLTCQKMELGEPDASGRRRPIPITGETFYLEADVVINALGTQANPLLTATEPELSLNKWKNITADENGATSLPRVFAGGDIVRGGATVILAMGDGKKAAAAIHSMLNSE